MPRARFGKIFRFRQDQRGGLTAFGLFLFLTISMTLGIALDGARLYSARSQLQIAADSAAHAALYHRDTNPPEQARQAAVQVVRYGMPTDLYGDPVRAADIRFGHYLSDQDRFVVDEASRAAVMVTAQRSGARQNNVANYLLKLAGVDTFDAHSSAVFETFFPACFREGFVAEGVVDIQSNNNYYNGFCIHSNTHVELNSNNVFEAGTVVSMPNLSDLVLPQSGFETNEGLEAALRSGTYRLRVLNKVQTVVDTLLSGDLTHVPDYIYGTSFIDLSTNRLDALALLPGNMYRYQGGAGCKVTISSVTPITEIVFITNCEIKFATDTELNNVLIVSTDTGARSMNSASKLQLGLNDSCATGGGARLVAYGGVSFTSELKMFGSQIIALGDIEFSANADGIEGASMVAGGRIDGTSNMNMGFCLTGMEDNFQAAYFRLAR